MGRNVKIKHIVWELAHICNITEVWGDVGFSYPVKMNTVSMTAYANVVCSVITITQLEYSRSALD